MRCPLGTKKLAKCSAIAGVAYLSGSVRGGSEHYVAQCWRSDVDADWVNYKLGTWGASIRNGKSVDPPWRDPVISNPDGTPATLLSELAEHYHAD